MKPGLYLINSTGEATCLHDEGGDGDTNLLREYVEENGLLDDTPPGACDGCGREVTLMGNGLCGFCQPNDADIDRGPEDSE